MATSLRGARPCIIASFGGTNTDFPLACAIAAGISRNGWKDTAGISFANGKATCAEFPVYAVGRDGLRSMQVPESPALTAALRRIHLLHADVSDYLKKQPDNRFDVIYFDFMFHHTVSQTNNLAELRTFAAQTGLDELLWEEAKRVAKKRIIVKNRPFASWFKTHPPTFLRGGTYSRVVYGVWDL